MELLTPQEAAAFLKCPTRSIYELSMSPIHVSHRFKRLPDALKLPDDCVLHSCRHTFCTRLGTAGVSAFQIMRLAGHSSVAISLRYVHENQQALRDAIGKL